MKKLLLLVLFAANILWLNAATLTLDAKGGTCGQSSIESPCLLPIATAPANKRFLGWDSDASANTPTYQYGVANSMQCDLASDGTLYAIYGTLEHNTSWQLITSFEDLTSSDELIFTMEDGTDDADRTFYHWSTNNNPSKGSMNKLSYVSQSSFENVVTNAPHVRISAATSANQYYIKPTANSSVYMYNGDGTMYWNYPIIQGSPSVYLATQETEKGLRVNIGTAFKSSAINKYWCFTKTITGSTYQSYSYMVSTATESFRNQYDDGVTMASYESTKQRLDFYLWTAYKNADVTVYRAYFAPTNTDYPVTYLDGTSVTLPSDLAAMEKADAAWIGWTDGAENYDKGAQVVLSADQVFYGVYRDKRITLEIGEHGICDAPTEITTLTTTLPACTPNKGYRFLGWSENQTATAATYRAGDNFTRTEGTDVILYAIYEALDTETAWVSVTSTDWYNDSHRFLLVVEDGTNEVKHRYAKVSMMNGQAVEIIDWNNIEGLSTEMYRNGQYITKLDYEGQGAEYLKCDGNISWTDYNSRTSNTCQWHWETYNAAKGLFKLSNWDGWYLYATIKDGVVDDIWYQHSAITANQYAENKKISEYEDGTLLNVFHVYTRGTIYRYRVNYVYPAPLTGAKSQELTSNYSIVLPTQSDITSFGYNLIGWTDGVNEYEPGEVLTDITTDITLTAIFEQVTSITLNETENQSELLEALIGHNINVTLVRPLVAGMFNTICLPFSVNTLDNTPLANATVAEMVATKHSADDIQLSFNYTDAIEAGKPYLIQPEVAITEPMVFNDVTIEAADGAAVGEDDITFVGILQPTQLTAGDNHFLFLGTDNTLFYPASDDATIMKSMRGYFRVAEHIAQVPARLSFGRHNPTDMENLSAQNETQKMIINGQLIIMRNNVYYNTLGQQILK